ncbi:hypothetical protein [Chitinophaga flava]|uniref:Uncharacterized protein n=1 Tax=Chitinophaga flava TaxID=2259036 RepID=A0A365XTE7_9BACT|nr:hypothetical protein [Chitinophaga flava]RBL89646.1 hypothetical protein DF182_24405 [Chitinophaga flava]
MLKEGVKIIASEATYASLEISTGCEVAKERAATGISYISNAYKPRDEWRKITEDELSMLKADLQSGNESSSTIYIFDIPGVLKNKFENITLNKVISKRHFLKVQSEKKELFRQYADLLNKYCSHFLQEGKEISKGFYSVNDANLSTTTKYFKGKQYTGLHIDNIDNLAIDKAHDAQNRLCINLGTQKRYFLFVNQPLSEMKTWILNQKGSFNAKNTQWHLSQLFCRTYGTYPIVRIPLDPYQAYIAPTENILHDGSNIGSTAPDITYTLLGHFSL